MNDTYEIQQTYCNFNLRIDNDIRHSSTDITSLNPDKHSQNAHIWNCRCK